MNTILNPDFSFSLDGFTLPSFREIPNVGLYLEQVTKYIADSLEPIGCAPLTASMISNYVKKKIIRNPIRKQYDREHIACLFLIAVAKNILSLEDLQLLLGTLEGSGEETYEFFRMEFLRMLTAVFRRETVSMAAGSGLLSNVLLGAAHKIYLEHYMELLRTQKES